MVPVDGAVVGPERSLGWVGGVEGEAPVEGSAVRANDDIAPKQSAAAKAARV